MALSENGTMSPADLGAIMGNNSGFGGDGAWWIIILFLFVFLGMGNGVGFGNSGSAQNYTLSSDFATIQRQLSDGFATIEKKGDGIANGLCDGFYTQAQLVNGVNQNLMQQGYETRQAITQAQITEMNNANGLQQAISNGFCTTNYGAQANTREIIEAQNASTRAILDALNQQQTDSLKERIAEQAAQINNLQLAASQCAQNQYLVQTLGTKAPTPAYVVPNPYTYTTGCGCNA